MKRALILSLTILFSLPFICLEGQQFLVNRRKAFQPVGGSACDSLNDSNLKAYWPMDEASGSRTDTKNGNVLTQGGFVGSASGKISNAAEFVAANIDKLSIADNADVSCVGDMTITVWVKINTGGTGANYTLFEKGTEFYCVRAITGVLSAYVNDSIAGYPNGSAVLTTDTLPEDSTTWSFVVFQYRTSTKKVRVKINDGTWAEGNALPNSEENGTAAFGIGGSTIGFAYLQGDIDEFGKWDAVLSDTDLTNLYNSGNACRPAGL